MNSRRARCSPRCGARLGCASSESTRATCWLRPGQAWPFRRARRHLRKPGEPVAALRRAARGDTLSAGRHLSRSRHHHRGLAAPASGRAAIHRHGIYRVAALGAQFALLEGVGKAFGAGCVRTGLRVCPGGWRGFRHVEHWYFKGINGAVMGGPGGRAAVRRRFDCHGGAAAGAPSRVRVGTGSAAESRWPIFRR